MPQDVALELWYALSLMPLASFDLRAPVSDCLTASDASEQGGRVCFATRLKPQYLPVVQAELGTAPGRGRDLVGLVELFGGLGGARMAFERLGVDLAVYACSEIQPQAFRDTTARWPDCVHLGDVRLVDAAKVRSLLAKAPRVRATFAVGGSPCQGVSRINVGRAGSEDERARLARRIPRVAELI